MHAMEDLTGGVCRQVSLNDVLDKDLLWEQIRGNIDRTKLYACGSVETPNMTTSRDLVGRHAYAILRAGEYNGKRFLVIRNPWGNAVEWNGRWSDGSKEWTPEWRPALEILNHTFGQDGQFVMECKHHQLLRLRIRADRGSVSEFLRQWPLMDITRIFDSSWVSSCIWIDLPGMVPGQVPTWGDVSCESELLWRLWCF
jgi:Calpain family cysteine protease